MRYDLRTRERRRIEEQNNSDSFFTFDVIMVFALQCNRLIVEAFDVVFVSQSIHIPTKGSLGKYLQLTKCLFYLQSQSISFLVGFCTALHFSNTQELYSKSPLVGYILLVYYRLRAFAFVGKLDRIRNATRVPQIKLKYLYRSCY